MHLLTLNCSELRMVLDFALDFAQPVVRVVCRSPDFTARFSSCSSRIKPDVENRRKNGYERMTVNVWKASGTSGTNFQKKYYLPCVRAIWISLDMVKPCLSAGRTMDINE
ncbi:hypothetical protein RRG08_056616 [Elysia crispata]|uniref:Uncharacterized protein n=1 Tax=Elysia crispata TaxID=231223 RepID=A0AAE1B3U7_9GAST|nr:hypothetical protein RRG08_056616 [Elysia crispata]